MNSITEKEKKLNQTLEKLKNLDFINKDKLPELENLKEQKNQLEIEYKQLLENYHFLENENLKLKKEFQEFKSQDQNGKKKEQKLSQIGSIIIVILNLINQRL